MHKVRVFEILFSSTESNLAIVDLLQSIKVYEENQESLKSNQQGNTTHL